MGSMKKTTIPVPYFFDDKPLFGVDIGYNSVRVLQVNSLKKEPLVVGYGKVEFDPSAIVDGVIVEPEKIGLAMKKLFSHSLIGDITTRRAVVSVPISKTFTRSLDMPLLSDKDLAEAVKNEVEQYIPAAAEDLYYSYDRVRIGKNKSTIFIVAIPRKIVDSYVTLARLLNLEIVMLQTSSGAGANLFSRDSHSDLPTVLLDFGTRSADITLVDKNPIVSGTVPCGGEQITQLICEKLKVTPREAMIIKTKYGLSYSKKQSQIVDALSPILAQLSKEIQRTIRYYEERTKSKKTVSQVVIMGGGANMPGLADYLTNHIRLPVRAFDPTGYFSFGKLQPFSPSDRMSYVTSAGLSLYDPHEVLT